MAAVARLPLPQWRRPSSFVTYSPCMAAAAVRLLPPLSPHSRDATRDKFDLSDNVLSRLDFAVAENESSGLAHCIGNVSCD